MELLLVRHGDAEPPCSNDFSRKLTPKGEAQIGQLGDLFAHLHFEINQLITSPVTRAVQTAAILETKLRPELFREEELLSCGMAPEEACAFLRDECSDDECIMMVGHAPDLSHLAAYLTGMSGIGIETKKGSCVMLETDRPAHGNAMLCGLVAPWLLKKIKW
ncbi:MAG: SixA phosphatase family protein [Planctomycetota bacterium]